jgi:hypothetical protein
VIIRGQNEDLIDTWLRAKGIERLIALIVPGYIEALHVAARTDLVAFVPRRLIAALSKQLSLATVTPPLDPVSTNSSCSIRPAPRWTPARSGCAS